MANKYESDILIKIAAMLDERMAKMQTELNTHIENIGQKIHKSGHGCSSVDSKSGYSSLSAEQRHRDRHPITSQRSVDRPTHSENDKDTEIGILPWQNLGRILPGGWWNQS